MGGCATKPKVLTRPDPLPSSMEATGSPNKAPEITATEDSSTAQVNSNGGEAQKQEPLVDPTLSKSMSETDQRQHPSNSVDGNDAATEAPRAESAEKAVSEVAVELPKAESAEKAASEVVAEVPKAESTGKAVSEVVAEAESAEKAVNEAVETTEKAVSEVISKELEDGSAEKAISEAVAEVAKVEPIENAVDSAGTAVNEAVANMPKVEPKEKAISEDMTNAPKVESGN